ncbi:hypothetical protein M501DRAFT_929268 [Patellaria atrata CBS 101060]|uniref:Steroid 5-alpha reductase C-terminal domain-containing protein n=1 Tax=Patellaria atrata CBS 101060 TaxID=1346257 RepID=A0A9P4VT82_9PEZI|nr:hypothetical protein M501DRAFT_929268 [Patellaria atrata CBS 101060]
MESYDLISRGIKKPSPLGTLAFVGLRSLDPFLQYGILARGIGSSLILRLGLKTLPPGLPTNTGTFLDSLGLSPYRAILLGMAIGSAVKQCYWLIFVSQEEFKPSAAIPVAVYNTVFNSLCDLLFTCTATSGSLSSNSIFPQAPLIIGTTLYATGILTETISEVQRRNFKADPKNKGNVYTGGLFSLARHINYGSYALWRAGYALAAGNWALGLLACTWLTFDFAKRAIPVMDEYCTQRYGADWIKYKQETKSVLFPGIL